MRQLAIGPIIAALTKWRRKHQASSHKSRTSTKSVASIHELSRRPETHMNIRICLVLGACDLVIKTWGGIRSTTRSPTVVPYGCRPPGCLRTPQIDGHWRGRSRSCNLPARSSRPRTTNRTRRDQRDAPGRRQITTPRSCRTRAARPSASQLSRHLCRDLIASGHRCLPFWRWSHPTESAYCAKSRRVVNMLARAFFVLRALAKSRCGDPARRRSGIH
jgi:hypothetical protein